jgi:hypothetical protein
VDRGAARAFAADLRGMVGLLGDELVELRLGDLAVVGIGDPVEPVVRLGEGLRIHPPARAVLLLDPPDRLVDHVGAAAAEAVPVAGAAVLVVGVGEPPVSHRVDPLVDPAYAGEGVEARAVVEEERGDVARWPEHGERAGQSRGGARSPAQARGRAGRAGRGVAASREATEHVGHGIVGGVGDPLEAGGASRGPRRGLRAAARPPEAPIAQRGREAVVEEVGAPAEPPPGAASSARLAGHFRRDVGRGPRLAGGEAAREPAAESPAAEAQELLRAVRAGDRLERVVRHEVEDVEPGRAEQVEQLLLDARAAALCRCARRVLVLARTLVCGRLSVPEGLVGRASAGELLLRLAAACPRACRKSATRCRRSWSGGTCPARSCPGRTEPPTTRAPCARSPGRSARRARRAAASSRSRPSACGLEARVLCRRW